MVAALYQAYVLYLYQSQEENAAKVFGATSSENSSQANIWTNPYAMSIEATKLLQRNPNWGCKISQADLCDGPYTMAVRVYWLS